MPNKLEEKAKEPKILNDKFKKEGNKYFKKPSLHDYFLIITPKIMVYPENSQITFTP